VLIQKRINGYNFLSITSKKFSFVLLKCRLVSEKDTENIDLVNRADQEEKPDALAAVEYVNPAEDLVEDANPAEDLARDPNVLAEDANRARDLNDLAEDVNLAKDLNDLAEDAAHLELSAAELQLRYLNFRDLMEDLTLDGE